MGIFKNITKTLKQARPVIGSAIGMYFGGPKEEMLLVQGSEALPQEEMPKMP